MARYSLFKNNKIHFFPHDDIESLMQLILKHKGTYISSSFFTHEGVKFIFRDGYQIQEVPDA